MSTGIRQIWHDMTVFDGQQTLPEPMTVTVAAGRVESVQPSRQAPAPTPSDRLVHQGGVMTPGLVDCHTHLVFGGQRADEFEQRLEGKSYEAIARAGGGILSTVKATRAASEQSLFDQARPRLEALIADGVTTVEIKSGYGLTTADECKMLRVARRLGQALPVNVQTTFLGAHALPPEYRDNADGYIDKVCQEMIPAVAAENLADAVDVFCEGIAFSVEQSERVFQAAQAHGLAIKAHAEQLSNLGGSILTARYRGLSADHVEWLDEPAVRAMAAAGTVATLLPGAFYTLRETRVPPVDLLRQYQVPMAIATDGNPGSSPIFQLTLMLHMACTLFRLTPTEALQGVTAHGARALGLQNQTGRIAPGYQADLCAWDCQSPNELAYSIQSGRLVHRVLGGEIA